MSQKLKNENVVAGMVWMFVISVLLFWLPGAGALIAGLVGGKKAGSVGAAIMAVFLPGILFGFILFLNVALFLSVPLLGIVAGFGGFILSITHVGPMLLGAIIGGFLAEA